ncbi:MAG TPA: CAP domain-containing protein [Thermoanaerobaculia bacterium]|nr:CAP domain-containing protein [Thermoanaerobaculia bacterium]
MKRTLIMLVVLLAATPIAHSDIDTTRATLRAHVLRLINRDRALYKLPPVQLDEQATLIGDDYCRAQIRNRTTGHYTIDGVAPYARYSFAGGNDAVSENAAAWSATYTFNEKALYEMVRRSQDAMMAEMAPADGHKRTMLDPHATHVGVGLAWEGGEFRLVQEFVRRYVDWTRALPRTAALDQTVLLSGKALRGVSVEGITVHHEPLPQPIAATTASAISFYSLPDKRREYAPRARAPHGLSLARRTDFTLRNDGTFSFIVPFSDGPGLYTVVVWVKKDGEPNAFSASNVSIRVEGGLQSAARASALK